MSISASLLVTQSGLRATQTRASLVSSNIANAQAEGYVRRDAIQHSTGRSVDVELVRQVDERLVRLGRGAASEVAAEELRAVLLKGYLTGLGDPANGISPAARLGEFQEGLDLLANAPDNPGVQRDLLQHADGLVRSVNEAAMALGKVRDDAQSAITQRVSQVNETLAQLVRLNAQIVPNSIERPSPDILDQIALALDGLAETMGIVATFSTSGRIQVQTENGTQLLRDTEAAEITLSGLTLAADGIDITPGRAGARGFETGSMGGAFTLLNEDLPRMQRQIDELAAGLVQVFQSADASLAVGEAGLFTDDGAAFDPSAIQGLAARLAVNAAVQPSAGGDLWRLRTGVAAAGPGAPGASSQVQAFIKALETPRTVDPATGIGSPQRLMDYAAEMVVAQHQVGVSAEDSASLAKVSLRAFETARGAVEGVNVDQELQKLLEIEQAYGANAKVLNALIGMVDTLLEAF